MTAPAEVGRQMTITDLRIHPIKSCRGISLKSSRLTRKGLEYDRHWLFVDAANKFMTIRGQSKMTLIKPAINHATGNLEVTLPAVQEASFEETVIKVPLNATKDWFEANCTLLDVEIWGIDTDSWTYNDSAVNEPIKKFFQSIDPDSDVKLVVKGPTRRAVRGNGAEEILGRKESVDFPDALPVLVASEASLGELNSRLEQREEKPITIERFRPNIVVASESLVPWEEDEWKLLRINPPMSLLGSISTMTGIASETIDIDVSCRCARCQVPNVDPETAEKNPKEPWNVLCSYRRIDEGMKFKPCFGMLCCPRSEGHVEVGMKVEVRAVMEPAGGEGNHKYIKPF